MILPVLDIMAGQVVRGIAGRRHEYRPLTPVCDPLAIARSFRARFDLSTLYLADLDAIAFGEAGPSLSRYQDLIADDFALWVDAGLKRAVDAEPLFDAGVARAIAGLETLAGPAELETLVRTWSPARIVFSLDLKAGAALGSWDAGDPESIAAQAVAAGATSLLILDLSRVGVGTGIGTEELCRTCRRRWPHVELIAGGGVRGPDDLRRLAAIGVDHVLVASALHDGRLTREDVNGRP